MYALEIEIKEVLLKICPLDINIYDIMQVFNTFCMKIIFVKIRNNFLSNQTYDTHS